jgi:hypothetical protein
VLKLAARSSLPAVPGTGKKVYLSPDNHIETIDPSSVRVRLDHEGMGSDKFRHVVGVSTELTTSWIIPNKRYGELTDIQATTHERLYLIPWPTVMEDWTISDAGIWVSSAGSGGAAEATLAIYYGLDEDDEGPKRGKDLIPGTLLSTLGVLTVASTGLKQINGLNIQLREGRMYWGALWINCTTPPTLKALLYTDAAPVHGVDSTWTGAICMARKDTASGITDPAPSSLTWQYDGSINVPIFGVKRSA